MKCQCDIGTNQTTLLLNHSDVPCVGNFFMSWTLIKCQGNLAVVPAYPIAKTNNFVYQLFYYKLEKVVNCVKNWLHKT